MARRGIGAGPPVRAFRVVPLLAVAIAVLPVAGPARAADGGDDAGWEEAGWEDDGEDWGDDDFLGDFESGFEVEEIEAEFAEAIEAEVVTPSRRSQPASVVPLATSRITREDLERYGVLDLADALRLVPGLSVARPRATQAEVAIRGPADPLGTGPDAVLSRRVLVLVDGRPVGTDLGGGATWAGFPVPREAIDRIEVVRGPAASIYGSEAFAGVVHVITRGARDSDPTDTGAVVGVGGGDPLHLRAGGSLVERAGSVGYRLAGEVDSTDRFDDRGEDLGARTGSLDAAIEWRPDEERAVEIRAGGILGRAGRAGTTLSGVPVTVDRTTTHVAAGLRWSEVGLDLAWQRHEEDPRARESDEGALLVHRVDGEAAWATTFLGGSNLLELGLGGTWHSREALALGIDDTRWIAAAFASHEIRLVDDIVRIVTAARVEHVGEPEDTSVAAHGALVLTPLSGHALRLSVARAVQPAFARATSADASVPVEIDGSTVDLAVVGDPDLDPASVLTYEVGYRNRVSETFDLDVDGWYAVIDDLAVLEVGFPRGVGTGALARPRATGEVDGYGVEVSIRSRWSSLDLWASYGLAILEAGDERIEAGPRHDGGLGATWSGSVLDPALVARCVGRLPRRSHRRAPGGRRGSGHHDHGRGVARGGPGVAPAARSPRGGGRGLERPRRRGALRAGRRGARAGSPPLRDRTLLIPASVGRPAGMGYATPSGPERAGNEGEVG